MDLSTTALRAQSLLKHINWKNITKTCYISTTTSLEEVEDILVPHMEARQDFPNTKLTLINLHARRDKRMPILNALKETEHYRTKTHDDAKTYFKHFWALPFNVGFDETMKTVTWVSVRKWMDDNEADMKDWAREFVEPLWENHEAARKAGSRCEGTCTCCAGNSNCTCCGDHSDEAHTKRSFRLPKGYDSATAQDATEQPTTNDKVSEMAEEEEEGYFVVDEVDGE